VLRILQNDEKKFLRMPYIISASKEFKQTKQAIDKQMQTFDKETKPMSINNMI